MSRKGERRGCTIRGRGGWEAAFLLCIMAWSVIDRRVSALHGVSSRHCTEVCAKMQRRCHGTN